MSIEDRLLVVFQDVFGPEVHALSETDSPETLEDWDSASHVNLMLALEAEFELEFEADEIAELASVGAIRRRLAAA